MNAWIPLSACAKGLLAAAWLLGMPSVAGLAWSARRIPALGGLRRCKSSP